MALRVASLDSPADAIATPLNQESDSFAEYAQGYLLFIRGTTLMARPFDPKHLAFTGDALSAAEPVRSSPLLVGVGAFSVSANGLLVYEQSSGSGTTQLTRR